jgi:hypothetical protein
MPQLSSSVKAPPKKRVQKFRPLQPWQLDVLAQVDLEKAPKKKTAPR